MRPSISNAAGVGLLVLLIASARAATPCNCGCCAVRTAEAPAADPVRDGAAECALQTETCSGECEPEGSALVEYARFCFEDCRPSSHDEGGQCVLISSLDQPIEETVRAIDVGPADTSSSRGGQSESDEQAMLKEASLRRAAAQKKAMSKAPKENAQKATALLHQKQAPEVTPTQLQLAKAAMLEAKTHAKAAGAAARRAKESYELALRSAREMAEYAGRLAYDEVQREAGEQAKKALKIRNDYVKAAQDAGIANAKAAAAPYKKMAVTATNTAAMWNLRANEFAGAAGALKGQAEKMARDAAKYTETEDWSDAETFSRQAHQLVTQSQEMADRADSAHTQANEIQKTMNWYSLAGRGAAASALAGSMPYDVPPPPLPNTVFL